VTELEFLHYLAYREAEALEKGDPDAAGARGLSRPRPYGSRLTREGYEARAKCADFPFDELRSP